MTKHIKDRKKHLYLSNKEINTKAQVAYETYAKNVLKNAAHGNVMPVWEDLYPNQREAWRSVILSIQGLNLNPNSKTFLKPKF